MQLVKDLFPEAKNLADLIQKGWLTPQFLIGLNIKELQALLDNPGGIDRIAFIQLRTKLAAKTQTISLVVPSFSTDEDVLSTGISNMDLILDGNGYRPGEITLFYGKGRSGKTQLGHMAAVQAYIRQPPLLNRYTTIYIDTEDTFRPERIVQMSRAAGVSGEKVLKSIYVIHINSLSGLNMVVPKLGELFIGHPVNMVVIDSLTNFYRVEIGKKEKSVSLIISDLGVLLKRIQNYAKEYHFPVVCTSQVMSTPGPATYFEINPILANTLNFFIKQWVLLGENPQISAMAENPGRRFAHLINGQEKPEQIVQFQITPEGIRDIYQ